MTQTYETPTSKDSYSENLDSTLAGANFIPRHNSLEELTIHTALHESINEYLREKQQNDSPDTDSLARVILEEAQDLATSNPSSIEDVVLLGNAWDITHDDELFQAIEDSISVVPSSKAEIQALKSALDKIKSTGAGFMSSYLEAEVALLDRQSTAKQDDMLDAQAFGHSSVFLDMSPHAPYAEDVIGLAQLDERNERLAIPVAMPFVTKENTGDYLNGVKIDYPMINYDSRTYRTTRIRKVANAILRKNAS